MDLVRCAQDFIVGYGCEILLLMYSYIFLSDLWFILSNDETSDVQ